MIKKIYELMKRIIFSIFLLYSFNLVMAPLELIVPINLITVSAITILGFPALISFVVILLLIY